MEKSNSYDFIHKSLGKNDECWTERYAVEPLLQYLGPFKNKIIWCPFDTEESEFVKVFSENGYNVIYSHISTGQDFYTYEPEKWDILVSNPPFTNKRYIFRRALSFNKPFCLLMNIAWLNDSAPVEEFWGKDLQLLLFKKRMQFKTSTEKKKINFSSAYFCWNFLPKQIILADFSNRSALSPCLLQTDLAPAHVNMNQLKMDIQAEE